MTKNVNTKNWGPLNSWTTGGFWSWVQGLTAVFDYPSGIPSANQSEFVYTDDADYPLFSGTELVVTDGTIGEHEAAGSWYGTKVNITAFVTDFTFKIGAEAISGEAIGTWEGSSLTHALARGPRPGTIVVTAGSVTGADNGSGVISGAGISGTIDYRSRVLSITSTTAANGTAITCAYSAPAFGMCFVIHNDPKGTGASADANGLGYMTYTYNNPDPSIQKSIAVVFNASAGGAIGNSMVGCYLNGGPYVNSGIFPLQDMAPQGIDLYSGNAMSARITYDGTMLTLYLTDTVTGKKARFDWKVDIPTIVGADTAYIGFGGGTIPAGQQVVPSWSYWQGSDTRLSPPTFGVAAGQYTSSQTVSISAAPGATIYYTTDGTPPTDASAQYTGPLVVSTTTFVQAIAVKTGYEVSFVASALYLIQASGSPTVNFPSGFVGASGLMRLAGAAAISGSTLQVTDGLEQTEAGTAFYVAPVTVTSFSTAFTIKFGAGLQGSHNGMMFVIANPGPSNYADASFALASPLAIGATSANLNATWGGPTGDYNVAFSDNEKRTVAFTNGQAGIGPWAGGLTNAVTTAISVGRTVDTCVSGGPYSIGRGGETTESFGYEGIGNSIAVMFGAWGGDTGLAIGGGAPLSVPVSGINVGVNPLACTLSYDGTTLTLHIEDTVTLATFSTSWPINISAEVGANTASVGFTGGSYDSSSSNEVVDWTGF